MANYFLMMARSILDFYRRFGVRIEYKRTLPRMEEEYEEWKEAARLLLTVQGSSNKRLLDQRRREAKDEFGDMMFTLVAHGLAVGLSPEDMEGSMLLVADKNGAKQPGITHVFDGIKIRRMTPEEKENNGTKQGSNPGEHGFGNGAND